MPERPPTFRYHPDPERTGSVVASDAECIACSRRRGLIYVGPTFGLGDYVDAFCPWCIAEGIAAARFGVEFTDVGVATPAEVPATVLEELGRSTPGFEAWQDPHWLFHCSDACAFLGRVGRTELSEYPDALEGLVRENDEFGWTPAEAAEHVDALEADGESTAYLFRCLSCGTHLAYSDSA